MSLERGTILGAYEILGPIGAGGMGEVYKAKDTRLGRTVAIKVIPEHLAANPELRKRFEQEARAVSSLNHPNICTLHDIGCEDGVDFMVLEYVEGETLLERLKRGPLPLEEVLRYAIQIADALDKAHRHGIVHRDLKPGNIIITRSGVKLLDFGLAKFHPMSLPGGVDSSSLETEAKPLTQEGSILGTFQYMAPEQLESGDVDGRTDLFAFGALVYEMLTGKKVFEGKSQASLIGAILKDEPQPMKELGLVLPASLEWTVRRCLAKVPDERWQSAGDLTAELKWIAVGVAREETTAKDHARASKARLAWPAATFLLLLALVAVVLVREQSVDAPRAVTFEIRAPAEGSISRRMSLELSPDGSQIAWVSNADGRIWLRSLDALSPTPLNGTQGAIHPFWSPDGRSLGFFQGGEVRSLSIADGSSRTIASGVPTSFAVGGTWSRDERVVFADLKPSDPGLFQVSAAGGVAEKMTLWEPGPRYPFRPAFLPDGRHVLFTAKDLSGRKIEDTGLYIASVDAPGSRRLLGGTTSQGRYTAPGYLLYVRDERLIAHEFDANKRTLGDRQHELAEPISVEVNVTSQFSVSENGVVVYRTGASVADARRMGWYDRSGRALASVEQGEAQLSPELSSDGQLMASIRRFEQSMEISIQTVSGGIPSQFTFDAFMVFRPVWAPDDSRIAFGEIRDGESILFEQSLGAGGTSRRLLAGMSGGIVATGDWSQNGLIAFLRPTVGAPNIWMLPTDGDEEPFPAVESEHSNIEPQFSPDGELLAYASNDYGRYDVFVVSLSSVGTKRRISTDGGRAPRWRGDGKELFYTSSVGKMMAVEMDGAEPQSYEVLFDLPGALIAEADHGAQYDVTADGQRFLLNVQRADANALTVVLDLAWELER